MEADLLNRYFVQVGDIIERNGGLIDKFVGDGMMALFGVLKVYSTRIHDGHMWISLD